MLSEWTKLLIMTKLWIILFFCASAVKSQIHSKTRCLKNYLQWGLLLLVKTQLPPQLWKPFRCLILLQHPVNTHLSDTTPASSSTTTLSTTTHGHKKKSNIFTVFLTIIRSETSQIWFTKMEMKDWSVYNICSFDVVYIILVMMSL